MFTLQGAKPMERQWAGLSEQVGARSDRTKVGSRQLSQGITGCLPTSEALAVEQ